MDNVKINILRLPEMISRNLGAVYECHRNFI